MSTAQAAFELYRSGDLPRAEEQARAALAIGDHPGLRHLLGILLCQRGRLDEGAEELARALEMAPGHPEIRMAYVRALIDLGRADEALRHARRPAPGPAAIDLWRLRAEAAEAAGALADRAEAGHYVDLELTKAELARRPGDRELWLRQARLLGVLMRDADAEGVYRDILRSDPGNSEAALDLGLVLERGNRVDDVRDVVDAAVSAGAARDRFALLEAFLAWRHGKAEETLEWLAKPDAAWDPLRANRLETKAQDALGNSEAAFRAAQAMNDAVRDRGKWRRAAAAYRTRLRRFSRAITPEWAATWNPVAPVTARPPAFLIGFPRSGTTLLDTLLMGHPDVAVLEEVPVIGLVAERLGALERIPDLDDSDAEELRRFYFERVARLLPQGFSGLLVDKLPMNMINAPLIHRLFPDAKFIFARRHPCDCVLSAFFQGFGMNPAMACFLDIADAADLYDVSMEIWTASEALLPLNVHGIVYEEMVEQPGSELRRLLSFLDLEWDERVLDHRTTARERGAIGTASYDQVTEAITTRAVGRWKRYAKQLEPVLPVLLPWAERLGYRD